MFFQYLSDIHLERKKLLVPTIKKISDVLLLAGDIGSPHLPNYQEFLYQCSDQFSQVFLVAGNHEYWNSTITDTNGSICSIVSKMKNVHYLNNSAYVYKDKVIFGGTFWTYVLQNKENSDSKFIKGFNNDTRNQLHCETYNLIKNIRPDIVLSHYPPVRNVIHPNYNHYRYELFTNDSPELLEKSERWVCGHLHHFTEYPKVCMNIYKERE